MPKARVTSKGQVTIPAEVRKALGVGPGDDLVFEAKAGYAVVRKRKTIEEVAGRLRKYAGRRLDPEAEKEAVGRYLRELDEATKPGGSRAS